MDKVKVAVATYTNTIPFLRGLQHSVLLDSMELVMDYPSACAERLVRGEVDLGIVPIRTLLDMPEHYIVGNHCIGTEGAVDSVFIFSNVPIEQVRTLRLDNQSKTSNGLARILLRDYWKRDVVLTESGDADAYVLIGDRTFGKKDKVPYAYDLGYYWRAYTGLPFAFAVWASNKPLPKEFEQEFDLALKQGVERIEHIIPSLPPVEDFDYRKYLTKNLSFDLTEAKRKAIALYLNMCERL